MLITIVAYGNYRSYGNYRNMRVSIRYQRHPSVVQWKMGRTVCGQQLHMLQRQGHHTPSLSTPLTTTTLSPAQASRAVRRAPDPAAADAAASFPMRVLMCGCH